MPAFVAGVTRVIRKSDLQHHRLAYVGLVVRLKPGGRVTVKWRRPLHPGTSELTTEHGTDLAAVTSPQL